ncbi:MAG: heparan-alpha-glucosaminide N-acetyltransferase domain-containing protein [Polyangiales bacterium]
MGKSASGRVAGIDVARALAALIMLQGHATDGWVRPEHEDAVFRASRFLGTFPLPAFLLLAGTSVAWRVAIGEERGESPRKIGRALTRRGLGLVLTGYVVSFAFALMDGATAEFLPTLLRADVLHVIGASIALAGALVPARADFASSFVRRSVAFGIGVTILCPLLPAFDLPLPAAALVGVFVDAAPVTRMPLVPLFAWFAAGALCTSFMRGGATSPFAQVAGTTKKRLAVLAIIASGAAAVGWNGMNTLHEAFGGTLSRQHIAIVANVLDLAGRGALVLVVGAALAPFLSARVRFHLVLLGRGSLTAYVVHLPFCYGRLGSPLRASLTSAQAVLGILVLAMGTYVCVRVWPALREGILRRRS